MKKIVLGVSIDDISLNQAVKIVEEWLKRPGKHYIVTPNPEFIIKAIEDEGFKKIISQADLSLPDGQGLKFGSDIVCNTPGIDVMEALVKLSNEKGFTIGLLGGSFGVAKKVSECLRKKYPKLKVSFAIQGPTIYTDKDLWVPDQVRDDGADILFVAFGHPKQEKWIAKNLKSIPVKVAMGVGGAFDYLSGAIPRAPKFIRALGLEWLFRLIIQPWRIKRQLGLMKYVWLVLKSRS